jgi:hypothetical protein
MYFQKYSKFMKIPMKRRRFLHKLLITVMAIPWAIKIWPRKCCGNVTWCFYSPANVSWQVYKFTVLDAFEMAKNLIYAAGQDNFSHTVYRLGPRMASIVVCLSHFKSNGHWERSTLPNRPVDIGKIGVNTICYDPNLKNNDGVVEVGRYFVPVQIVYQSPSCKNLA